LHLYFPSNKRNLKSDQGNKKTNLVLVFLSPSATPHTDYANGFYIELNVRRYGGGESLRIY